MTRKASAVLAAVALVFALGGVATAGDFTLVPSTVPGCGACTSPVTNVFGFTFLGTTFSETTLAGATIAIGDTFTDVGALTATQIKDTATTTILPGVSGLNVNWQLGAIFSLPGVITNVVTTGANSVAAPLLTFTFDPGSTLIIYAEPMTGTLHNTNDPTTIADGTVVGVLSVVSGGGTLDFNTQDGNVDVLAEFTSILPGFWELLGIPISLGTQVFLALTDSNNDILGTVPASTASNFTDFFGISPDAPTTSSIERTWLSNDGSVEFATTPVANPSVLMLLGTGLLTMTSMVVYRRRRA